MNIGIFDSGSGGRFVADKLRSLLPNNSYHVINDELNAPYGDKDLKTIRLLAHQAIQPLISQCPIIVVACNTATAAALESLRAAHPNSTFIGFEPMIKPAALLSSAKHVTLLATRATATSNRTRQLLDNYTTDCIVTTPDTTAWATLIDSDQADTISLNEVEASVTDGSDSIIIGCTHYIALIPMLRRSFPATKIYEPTEAIARRIVEVTAG